MAQDRIQSALRFEYEDSENQRTPAKCARGTKHIEPSPPDIFHVTKDDEYLQLVRAEAEFWDARPNTLASRTPVEGVERYHNERLTGDPGRQWFETISDYGDFQHGCVLGAGPGNVESYLLQRHPSLSLTVYDISGESLARLKGRLEGEYPSRVQTRQEDLNFVTMPAEAFDLVVARSSMHHILNLEHLAFQINQSLTPEGFFFMHDHVSESRFQHSFEKKRLFEAFMSATRSDPPAINWPDLEAWRYSPLEAVRSGEILGIFGSYLREVRLRTCDALLALSLHVVPRPDRRQANRLHIRAFRKLLDTFPALRERFLLSSPVFARMKASGELLIMLDRICSETGYLMPSLAFATYQKRESSDATGEPQ